MICIRGVEIHLLCYDECGDIDEYSIEVEEAFFIVSSKARFVREMVDETISKYKVYFMPLVAQFFIPIKIQRTGKATILTTNIIIHLMKNNVGSDTALTSFPKVK